MDERLPGCRYDACGCRPPGSPLDDLRDERRELSTPGRRCPCTAQAAGRQRQQERQPDGVNEPDEPPRKACNRSPLSFVTYRNTGASSALPFHHPTIFGIDVESDALPTTTQAKGRQRQQERHREAEAVDRAIEHASNGRSARSLKIRSSPSPKTITYYYYK